jgi:hypothetical protein
MEETLNQNILSKAVHLLIEAGAMFVGGRKTPRVEVRSRMWLWRKRKSCRKLALHVEEF